MAAIHRMNALRLVRGQLATKTATTPMRSLIVPAARAQQTTTAQEKRTTRSPIVFKATFHASARRAILPPLPERINGGPNEPVPIKEPNPVHGSYHWAFERLISIALIPLTIAPFAAGSLNPLMDGVLCSLILLHTHIGFQSVIIDYIPTWRLPFVRKLFWWGLRFATIAVGVGLYEYETHDIGVTETVKRAWKA